MKNEAYQKLKEVDYSRVRNQIITVLTKFAQTKKTERGYKSEKVYMDYDVMGLACFILFLMIDTSINSFEDFETSFEDIVSNALDLHDVSMRQESIGMYFEEFTRTEEVELITELRKLANSIEFDELVAYILFADVADEIDLSFRKTPASICKLAEKILDIQQGDCVADFSTGEKNFVPEIYFRNREANYKFFNIAEETYNIFHYLRCALQGISITNDIVCTMYEEEAEALYDKVFQDYSCVIHDSKYSYPFETAGINKEWKYAYRITQLLKPKGKAVMIVSNIGTTTPKDASARRWFVKNGYIESIIALPEKMYKGTNVAFVMLVLSKENENIRFIDATEKGTYYRDGAKRMMEMSDEDIAELSDAITGKNGLGRNVAIEDVLNNESIVNPIAYCTKLETEFESVELQNVIRSITRGTQLSGAEVDRLVSEEVTDYKYLRPIDIQEGIILTSVQHLRKIEEKQKKYVANKNDLVISKNGGPFKIASIEEDNVLISSNLYKIELDESKMNSVYLKGYLESEHGQAELKKASSGGTIMMLGIDALRKIKVPQMPIEEQNKVVEEYENLTEEILRKQKEIEKLSIMRKTLFR